MTLLFELGPIKIYEEGIRQGIFISLRFFFLILMTSLLTLTTTPIEITDGLETLLHPLKKIHFPVHEMALMMSISLRFIPTLMQETDKIMKAQLPEVLSLQAVLKERIKAVIPLLSLCLSAHLNGLRSLRLPWKQEATEVGKEEQSIAN